MRSSPFCFSVKLVKACLSTPVLPSIHGVSYDIIIKINLKMFSCSSTSTVFVEDITAQGRGKIIINL